MELPKLVMIDFGRGKPWGAADQFNNPGMNMVHPNALPPGDGNFCNDNYMFFQQFLDPYAARCKIEDVQSRGVPGLSGVFTTHTLVGQFPTVEHTACNQIGYDERRRADMCVRVLSIFSLSPR